MAREASLKRMKIEEDIARIGGYINERLGPPDADGEDGRKKKWARKQGGVKC